MMMVTHTSCHHHHQNHRCTLWTKTATINNVTTIDIHITVSDTCIVVKKKLPLSSTSMLVPLSTSFSFLQLMHCTEKTATTIFSFQRFSSLKSSDVMHLENRNHHHLLRDSPQTLSSLLDCLPLHSHHLSCPPCKQHFCSTL